MNDIGGYCICCIRARSPAAINRCRRTQRIIKKAVQTLSVSKGSEVAVAYQSVLAFFPQTEGE